MTKDQRERLEELMRGQAMTTGERELLELLVNDSLLRGKAKLAIDKCLNEHDRAIEHLSDLVAMVEMLPECTPGPNCDLYVTVELLKIFLRNVKNPKGDD